MNNLFRIVTNPQNVMKQLHATIYGRNDYPPAERELISKYGNAKIIKIVVYKEQIDKMVNMLTNLISLGQFNKIKNTYNIDELYHLFMVITLDGNIPILLEKNDVINIHEYPTIKSSAQSLQIILPPNFNVTFRQFLEAGENYMGKDYFTYDALNNNCQRYILSLLNAQQGLMQLNPTAQNFILQDISGLKRDLSKTSKQLFSGITGLSSRLNVLAKGAGFII